MIHSIKKHLHGYSDLSFFIISDIPVLDVNNYIVDDKSSVKEIQLNKVKQTLNILKNVKDYDVVYMIDADCIMIKDINLSQILPIPNTVLCCEHPWQTFGNNRWLLEQNPNSSAYLENSDRYFQSCFWGGSFDVVENILKEMDHRIETDRQSNLPAKWAEEGYLNKCIFEKEKTILDKTYIFPSNCYVIEKHKYDIKMVHFNSYSCGDEISILE